jgi:hypothetical protein
MSLAEGSVGPIILGDAAPAALRFGRTRGLVVSDAHGKYHESAIRKNVFSIMTPVAGTTIVAANVSPVAAGAATILTLWNPADSGFDLSIIKAWLLFISGTPGAGAFVYNTHTKVGVITAAENAAAAPNYASGAKSIAKGFSQTALTGGGAGLLLRPFAASFAGAIAATTPGQVVSDPVDGEIIVPPDAALTIAAPATGTTCIVVAGITYEQVQKPNS